MAFVRCEGLVKIYKVADLEVFALQGLDLEVRQGEILGVIGNSGSGKSTLLNILGALDQPTAGRCLVGEWDLGRLTPARRVRYQREVVGFVWQNSARNLLPYLTALENVEVPMLLAGRGGRAARQWALELLEAVGLKDRAHHRPSALSGGEQQRVSIALALANRPQLLLADEPTGAVDTATGERILEVFWEVNRRYGTTVIIVTHDRALARAVDRYVLIRDGKVAQEAVRRPAGEAAEAAGDGAPGTAAGATHEELVVVDRAGRIQIPRELLAEAGLGDRVRLEVEEGRIIVRRP
ncbi:MAG: ATP-binding cassette domain-containing protein [Firmicutes bacterium]|nr:ATP-binding cassette domain-containing protein [Bacillota bacterium]